MIIGVGMINPQESYVNLECDFCTELENVISRFRDYGLRDRDIAAILNEKIEELE